ncbi:EthD family reductase [Halobaculum sp. MBLA0143]|uniref:EthD family reductase n=1 Tax=Halobaculum sp. MBLA0143 TaxID=3079933 RepID=UPI0035259CE1
MHELTVAFQKRDDLTTEELRDYYHAEHVPLVRELPNLVGYEVTFPSDPERSPYDGIARLRFPDGEAMSEAMDTEAAAAMEADAAAFADTDSMVQVVGETESLLE